MRSLMLSLGISAFACLAAGCSSQPRLFPVQGTVTVNGKPLDVGYVTFFPDESKGNQDLSFPYGEIGPNGEYQMFTDGRPGTRPGWYKVVVTATYDKASPGRPPPGWNPKWLTDPKYTKPYTTDLTLEVIDNAPSGKYDLHLTN